MLVCNKLHMFLLTILQVSPDQGQFLAMLVKLMGAERCIELGTFTVSLYFCNNVLRTKHILSFHRIGTSLLISHYSGDGLV